jgi:RHS repeat-associated protein
LLPARSPLSPQTHWRNSRRARRRASGRSFPYNLRFPGQVGGGPAGLHDNYQRDYDPGTGRYVESDPIGFDGGTNTYAYVRGNPVSRIDPLGLCDDDEKARCKQVKNDAIATCSELLEQSKGSSAFDRCVNDYIAKEGCGPGGTPLPADQRQPVPPPTWTPGRQPPKPNTPTPNYVPGNNTVNAVAVALAIAALIGGLLEGNR